MSSLRHLLLVAAVGLTAPPLGAQRAPVILPSGVLEQRLRDDQLLGKAAATGWLARDALGVRAADDTVPSGQLRWLRPVGVLSFDSKLPLAQEDLALWTGRGLNAYAAAGFVTRWRSVHFVVAPEITAIQNLPFDVRESRQPGFSAWASPWNPPPNSIDLPSRPGTSAELAAHLGQSEVTVTARNTDFGVASTNEHWGPGIFASTSLGSASEGIPRIFARSAQPLHTRAGTLEWRLFGGTLTESRFFDNNKANDHRALSGAVVVFSPKFAPTLSIGAGRLVQSPQQGRIIAPAQAFRALTSWNQQRTPITHADSAAGDQLLTLFWRWLSPTPGLELYAEWTRQELPRSLRDLIVAPFNSQGSLWGARWAMPRADGALILGGEFLDVEQSTAYPSRPPRDFGTGAAIPQGFTQRGQPLGPFTGPGSSAQFITADRHRSAFSYGFVAARIRWNDGAFYQQPGANFYRRDISVLAGVHGSVERHNYALGARLLFERRFDYLFQNGFGQPGNRPTVNVSNLTLRFTAEPH
jgi:hypothetical protein